MKYIAKTFEGLETVLAKEIEDLGGTDITLLKRAVAFSGSNEIMYACNYMCRTALRILEVKSEFEVSDADDLYRKLLRFPWDQLIQPGDTIAVDAITSGEVFTHSKFTALKTKDAIVDKVRRVRNERPNVNIHTPTYLINIHIRNTTATLSLDTSGESLHMRGYRITSVDAPLNEALAAGLILMSDWDKSSTFLDPMCGSGTLLIEADRIARQVPPQQESRNFGFKRWRKYDQDLWDKTTQKYNALQKAAGPDIIGWDKNLRAYKVAIQNIEEANSTDSITVSKFDFFKAEGIQDATIIMNPPYDIRLKESDISKFYQTIGDTLKHNFRDCSAWIISGNIDALQAIRLRADKKVDIMNGGIPSKYYNYKLYEGSR